MHYKLIPEIAYDKDVTILFGTSTFLGGYGKYAHPYDFYSIRYVFAGAEKLKDEVRDLWIDKFGIRIFEGYGTTETAPVLSLNTPHFYRRGTVGQFLPDIEYRIEPVEGIETGGNLLIKGPNVMKGYIIPAEEWYDCGDVVELDEDEYIRIVARLKRFAKIYILKEYLQKQGFLPLLLPSKIQHVKALPLLGSGKVDYVTVNYPPLKT
ncbi:hypothetical protein HMPREF0083_01288 [Aneurinibacillus aneurinilyticus ATCC 12856]|uniref:AMP-dependent synthetase/ligase domain-containing protein n=1 Tax=Aneurinibacillus aneurinilyticus ATCC 12856 TaxID=649747 RepID=U1X6I5_ANEAE|nr:hypothetical protein HMPREF0083_01288 [Aneurinibacillus aneurinilyticus ATCC 12856]